MSSMMLAKPTALRGRWLLIVATGATIAAIENPVRLILSYEVTGALSVLDWTLTAVFLIDMLLHLHWSGGLKGNPLAAAAKGEMPYGPLWLIADVLAAIPFWILPVPRLCLLFRLLKLARVAELMRAWRHRAVQSGNALRLGFFLFWLALIAHWIACGWLALRGLPPEFDKSTHYVRAIYWCITTLATVGYGDITPSTNPQMIFAIAVMILGAGVYGYTIANVSTILANIDPAKVRYREVLEKLTAFMKYRKIPADLQQRILDYNSYLWEKRLGYDESAAIAGLPPSLRAEVSLFLNRDIIERVPLFRGASDEFVRAIALQMHPVIFTPGDYIMRAGEPGAEMYFISHGTVEIVVADGKIVATLSDGDFFGEMALLLNQPRTASARAVEYCDLYMLEKETFANILARFPDFAAHIEKAVGKRMETASSGQTKSAN